VTAADFPSLAEVLARHVDWVSEGVRLCSCFWTDSSPEASSSRLAWAEHVQAEWDRACRIETVERLNALPDDAIVGDNSGEAWRKSGMYYPDEPWWAAGHDVEQPATEIRLPARLLWHPDWSDQ
jgi:hypothetical protein